MEFIGKRQIELGDHETPEQTQLLDRGYIVVERYAKKESALAEFNTLKYKLMASFGTQSEEIFVKTNRVLNSIFMSARKLATHYWKRHDLVQMMAYEFQRNLDEMQIKLKKSKTNLSPP